MANWATTSYAIEGPKETLQKIYNAILDHPVEENSSKDWEGNVLKALNIDYEKHSMRTSSDNKVSFSGFYMRGFIDGEPYWDEEHDALCFDAEEAWGLTGFGEVLEKHFPDIKVFYAVEELGECIFATNDKEGKYFPVRFYVDTCIEGSCQSDYFKTKKEVYEWLGTITQGRIKSEQQVENFNQDDSTPEDNYIEVYEFSVQ